MSDQSRAWKLTKSIQLALIVGGIAGLITVGMTYNGFVGKLEPKESVLAGAAVVFGLTLIMTYVFDQISHSAQNIRRALPKRNKGSDEQPDSRPNGAPH